MPPLNLDLLDPDREGSLERYAAQIQELVLWIRDEGHILSSIDQHFVEQWWEAGYPLESILCALRESGERLKNRKSPPRGLPLRSMRRWVVKAGEKARLSSVGEHRAEPAASVVDPSDAASTDAVLESSRAGVIEGLRSDIEGKLNVADVAGSQALDSASKELEVLASRDLGESELFAQLLGLGRRYYDNLWEGLPLEERTERRSGISASLGDAAEVMDPEALEATLAELARRSLRAEDPLFDPQRYWSL